MKKGSINLDILIGTALEITENKNISNNRFIVISTGKIGAIEHIKSIYKYYWGVDNINEEIIKEIKLLLPEGCYIFKPSLKDGFTSPNNKKYFSIFDYLKELKINKLKN